MRYMPEEIPIPDVSEPVNRGYWEHAKKHELVIQRCTDCGTFRHTPQVVCYNCQSFNYEWHEVSGKGVVFTYTIAHHPVHPALKGRVPYNVVVVELPDAGKVHMIGNLIDCPNEEIRVGMPVEVTWEDIADDVTLPQWKRAT